MKMPRKPMQERRDEKRKTRKTKRDENKKSTRRKRERGVVSHPLCVAVLLLLLLGRLGVITALPLAGALLFSLLLSLALLLQVLLAVDNGLAVLADLNVAALVLALELRDGDASVLSVLLVLLLGQLGRARGLVVALHGGVLGGGDRLLVLLVLLVLLFLLFLFLLLLGLGDSLLSSSVLVASQTISIGVVFPGLGDIPLADSAGTVDSSDLGQGLVLQPGQVQLELGTGSQTQGGADVVVDGLFILVLLQSIDTGTKGGLGGDLAGHLALVAAGGLANERSVVDQTVLGSRVLGLEGTEQGLLGTEDLDGGTGALGQVHERTGVGNQAGTDQRTDNSSHVGGNGLHAGVQVAGQLGAVVGVHNNVLSKQGDVLEILAGNLATHADLGGGLDGSLNLLGQDLGQVRVGEVLAHTGGQDDLGVGDVVVEDLGQLGEMPAVPLLDAHHEDVELLVEVVEQGHGVDDHDVDLVGRELELVARQRVRQTQGHGLEASLVDIGDQARHVLANTTENLTGSGAGASGDGSQVVARQLRKGVAQNLVLNQDRRLLRLLLDLVQQLGQDRGDLAIDELVELGDGLDGAVPLLEQVELDPVGRGEWLAT